MRIKKYQKIICLGLALLSIMVLPCYAYGDNGNFNIAAFPDNNLSTNNYIASIKVENSSTFEYIQSLGYFENYEYLMSYSFDQYYKYYYLNSQYKNISFLLLTSSDVILSLYNGWDTNVILYEDLDIVIPYDDIYMRVKLYNISLENDILGLSKYGKKIESKSLNTNYPLIFDNIIVIKEVDKAVINITTYTNLLIQNFGKAFTFMTGPALPWVLLGITISLITFGIHYSKRII